jgi:hypothetical protein
VGIENGRFSEPLAIARRLKSDQDQRAATTGELRRSVDTIGVDPETLWELADRYGYDAAIGWGQAFTMELWAVRKDVQRQIKPAHEQDQQHTPPMTR